MNFVIVHCVYHNQHHLLDGFPIGKGDLYGKNLLHGRIIFAMDLFARSCVVAVDHK